MLCSRPSAAQSPAVPVNASRRGSCTSATARSAPTAGFLMVSTKTALIRNVMFFFQINSRVSLSDSFSDETLNPHGENVGVAPGHRTRHLQLVRREE